MSEYIPSPELLLAAAVHGDLRITTSPSHAAYVVWRGGEVFAIGSRELMMKIFEQQKGVKKMTTNVTPQVNIEKRIEQYVKLRDHIKELDDAHKASMAPFREALEKLNGLLLNHLNTVGVDSAKTGAGTVYKTNKESVSLEDPASFMRHVIGTENWDLLERKANLTACKAFAEENVTMPPGVKFSSTQVVGVRRG